MTDHAGINSAIDNAFAAVGMAEEHHAELMEDAEERGVELPQSLSTSGIWEDSKRFHSEKLQKDRDAKAKAAAEGKDDKSEKRERAADVRGKLQGKSRDDLGKSIDSAFAKSREKQKSKDDTKDAPWLVDGKRPKPLEPKAFADKEFVQVRKELRERSGGLKFSERMAQFEKWEAAFKADPVKARDQIMKAYLNYQPSRSKGDTAPGKAAKHLGDVMDNAFSSSDDLTDLKDYADKYGEYLPELMKRLNNIEKDLIDDPVGASARLAAQYGAIDTPAPDAGPKPGTPGWQAPPEGSPEHIQNIDKGLNMLVEQKLMPGLDNPEIAENIAFVLECMTRTGDNFRDLQTAYEMVVGPMQSPAPAPAQAKAEAPDPKGSRSISGAPSMSSGGKRSSKADGLDSALNRAFGGV